MTDIDVSIVIPAYCEEKRIGRTLDSLAKYLLTDSYFKTKNIEVIVVAANAPDATERIVLNKKALFKNLELLLPGERVGKGRDVQYGMLRAKGEYAVFMDADLATPLYHLREFVEKCKGGNDLVIGTRDLLKYKQNRLQGIFASTGNYLYRLISSSNIEDTQCGFKMFNRKALNACFTKLTIRGWGFDIELLEIAKVNNLRIATVRIEDWINQPYGTHNDSNLKIMVRSISDMAHVKMNRLRGLY